MTDQRKGKQFRQALDNISSKTKIKIDFFSNLDKSKVDIPKVSTGLISLDIALGGGLPRGDFMEIFGKPHAGKTTLSFFLMGQVQRQGGLVAFIDAEQDFDPSWAALNGVDVDSLIFCQPDTLENSLDIVDALIKTGEVDLIVVDSAAALTPKVVLENGMSEDTMGVRPKKLAQFFEKTKFFVKLNKTIVLFTNQWRDSLKAFSGADSPGGWAMKHYCGVRIAVWSNESTDLVKVGGDEPVGRTCHIRVVKNKVGIPYRQAEFRIYFDGEFSGVNRYYDLLEYAKSAGVIEVGGGGWTTFGEIKVQGAEKMLLKMKDDEGLLREIEEQVRSAMFLGGEQGQEGELIDEELPF